MRAYVCLAVLLVAAVASARAADPVHVWDKQELTFTATRAYANPYTDATVWVDLEGPGFRKRIYGFWDGGTTFRVRLLATAPGEWKWTSGSLPEDPGLAGKTGTFTAAPWTDAEVRANPNRRGMIRATANGHALEYADGTPYLAIGDTWFALPADRFKWYDDERERPIGPDAGFKDYVRFRESQGFNWICVIAAFPNWKTDDQPWLFRMNDAAGTLIRTAWMQFGTPSAKNMDNEGGRPFAFPGRVPGYEDYFPDMERLNPEYFKYLDRKIDYLNAHGFVPFIEAVRRDTGLCWSKFYPWPASFSRYVQYIFARYQANITVLAPVHLDILDETIQPAQYTAAVEQVFARYGPPPFGTLLSSNANPSTLVNWGDAAWVTLHQMGNKREHDHYWYLTEIFRQPQPKPALNGEPYYAGYKDSRGAGAANYKRGADGGTDRDNRLCRSGLYGSFLSGGLAGHVYGAESIWGSDIEPAAPIKMWDAFRWRSGAEVQHLRAFAFSIGRRYQDLEPLADLISPNKSHDTLAFEGWAFCARTPDKGIFLAYFEKDCPRAQVRGARVNSFYRARWFNPRDGTWRNVAGGRVRANNIGIILLPALPDDDDWGLKLVYDCPAPPGR